MKTEIKLSQKDIKKLLLEALKARGINVKQLILKVEDVHCGFAEDAYLEHKIIGIVKGIE